MLAPKLRFKEFNDEWKKVKINKILKIKHGKNQKEIECINGKYPILGTGGIIGTTNTPAYLKESVLIGRKGTIDKPMYINIPFWTVDTLFYSDVSSKYNVKFIYYLFNTINWKKYDESTGVPSLSANTIENIDVNISLEKEEQLKISQFLSLFDKKIELQQRKIEVLKMYKRGLINKIFNIQYNNNTLRLKDLIKEKSIRNKENIVKEVYSVNNKCGFILQAEQFKDREVASEDTSNYKIVQYNDFAYNPARINVGSIARMKKYNKGIISPMYICFSCKEKLLPEYLEYYYDSEVFRHEMTKRLEGSVRMCLSYEAMINIPLDLPKFEEQKRMTKVLVEIDNKIEKEETIYSAINRLKKGLLQKIFI